MSDFGRVGHIKNDKYAKSGGWGNTDCTFMVIGETAEPRIRDGKPMWRQVMVLNGVGYDTDRKEHGDIGAIVLDDPSIEPLDD